MKPTVLEPFDKNVFSELQKHVREIRKAFDAPGAVYHDVNHEENNKFNRWYWHNLPKLVALHHDPKFLVLASEIFGEPVKPSYVFLSMYGQDGICPEHTDRPQCKYTIDLQIDSDGYWPLVVDGNIYILRNGQAVAYSGTDQPHFRKSMKEDSEALIGLRKLENPPCDDSGKYLFSQSTFMDLAFFHFVPTNWIGKID